MIKYWLRGWRFVWEEGRNSWVFPSTEYEVHHHNLQLKRANWA